MTAITTDLSESNGNDLTMNAAINTATTAGIAIPKAAFL